MQILVRPNKLNDLSDTKRNMSNSISDISQKLNKLAKNLDWDIAKENSIEYKIKRIVDSLILEKDAMTGLSSYLLVASKNYEDCESHISNFGSIENSIITLLELLRITEDATIYDYFEKDDFEQFPIPFPRYPNPFDWSVLKSPLDNLNQVSLLGALLSANEITELASKYVTHSYIKSDFFDLGHSYGNIPQGDESKSLLSMGKGFNLGDDIISSESSVSVDFLKFDGEIKDKIGVEEVNLFGSNVILPATSIGIGGSISAIDFNLNNRLGNDYVAVNNDFEGKVLTAEANAQVEFDLNNLDANVQAEIGGAVFEGKVTSGYEIFGIRFDGEATGKALAAGVGGKVGMDDGKIEIGFGVSAILGIEFEGSIDFSGFKNPLENIKNPFTEIKNPFSFI